MCVMRPHLVVPHKLAHGIIFKSLEFLLSQSISREYCLQTNGIGKKGAKESVVNAALYVAVSVQPLFSVRFITVAQILLKEC